MSIFSHKLLCEAEYLLRRMRTQKLTLATAESCTGGLLSALITEIPGSSDVFTHGFVTYADAAKIALLCVPQFLIDNHGAVSAQVAIAMAEGALKITGASVAASITGIAGPGGAALDKPVGLVHIACARAGCATLHLARHFSGERGEIRLQAVAAALELAVRQVALQPSPEITI